MPQKVFQKLSLIEPVSLADVSDIDAAGMEVFKGVALTKEVNTHSLHFSDDAMRQVKDALDAGLGLFTDHNISADNRIGKTLKAYMRNDKVNVVFGVIPGLTASNTDDLIRIMQTAGSEMSISFYPAMDGIKCDVCRLTMNPYYYGYIFMCDNYHMLGEVYQEGEGNRVVTGEVVDVERTSELSIVGNGSDGGTEVLQQIAQHIDVSVPVMATMAELNNLNLNSLAFNLSDIRRQTTPTGDMSAFVDLGRNTTMNTPPTPQPNNPPTPEPTPTPNPAPTPPTPNPADTLDFTQMSNQDLVATIQRISQEKAELEQNIISQEVHDQALTSVTELQTQLDAANAKVVEFDAMKETLDAELNHWRETAVKSKKRQMGYNDTDPRLIQYKTWADACDDISRLRIDATQSFAAYAATCLDKTIMTIDVGDAPTRVGSGHSN